MSGPSVACAMAAKIALAGHLQRPRPVLDSIPGVGFLVPQLLQIVEAADFRFEEWTITSPPSICTQSLRSIPSAGTDGSPACFIFRIRRSAIAWTWRSERPVR